MDLTLSQMAALVKLTLQRPREAARVVMRIPLPLQARWGVIALMAVLSALLMQAMVMLLPQPVGPDGAALRPIGPFFWAGMVAFGMVVTALVAHALGRRFGGKGELADAVILIGWLQFIQLLMVVLQLLVMVVLPLAAPVVEIVAVVLFLWLLVNFVAEMHGFRSLGMVFLGVILAFVGIVMAMSLLLVLLGIGIDV